MTHVMIEDSPEGKWLLELIRNHKSVTVVGEKLSLIHNYEPTIRS